MVTQQPDSVLTQQDWNDFTSDGRSRFGAYLRLTTQLFDDGDGHRTSNPAEFAAAAWRIACPPVMSPAYVWSPPRIQSTAAELDDDGDLAVVITLAVPLPTELRPLAGMWRSWMHYVGSNLLRAPIETRQVTALTSLVLRVPIAERVLPTPRYVDRTADTDTAKRAVRALCKAANTELAPLVAALDGPGQVTTR